MEMLAKYLWDRIAVPIPTLEIDAGEVKAKVPRHLKTESVFTAEGMQTSSINAKTISRVSAKLEAQSGGVLGQP